MTKLESYFDSFRKEIIGIDQHFKSLYGEKKIIYADWIASGRLYKPIEKQITEVFGPFAGDTHSETSENAARHPITMNNEVEVFIRALHDIVANHEEYAENYTYFPKENIFRHRNENQYATIVKEWFNL